MSDNSIFLNEEEIKQNSKTIERKEGEPTLAFKGASYAALLIGVASYLLGLYNSTTMQLNEKGYYFAILLFGLYSAVSLQKAVRDTEEGIPVTKTYYAISWFALLVSVSLMTIGLWNAGSIILSEKGFYGISFTLSLFASITVQKNVRDTKSAREKE